MASIPVHAPTPSAIEREREAQHRAELAVLVSRVVPRPRPAVDLLLALARPSAAPEPPLTPLKVGHDERNIDFWDERKFKDYLKRSGSEPHDKLELTREQVGAVKATHKAFASASKRTAAGFEEPERTGSHVPPERLSDEILISRSSQRAVEPSSTGRADIDVRKLLAREKKYPQTAFDSLPGFGHDSDTLQQALDLGLTATAADLAALRQKRETLRTYHKKSLAQALLQQGDTIEWLETAASRTGQRVGSVSPPLFSRNYQRSNRTGEDPREARPLSPWAIKEEPSSPRFTLEEDWRPQEEEKTSPPTSEVRTPSKANDILSSPKTLPRLPVPLTQAESPIFARRAGGAEAEDVPDIRQSAVEALRGAAAPTQAGDSADSSMASPLALGPTAPAGIGQLIDTLLEEPGNEMEVKSPSRQAPYPHSLKVPVTALPTDTEHMGLARVPDKSDFDRNAKTPFALVPMAGLRSLTLELSWKAWSLPEEMEVDSELDESLQSQQTEANLQVRQAPLAISPLSSPLYLQSDEREDSDDEQRISRARSKHARGDRDAGDAATLAVRLEQSDAGDTALDRLSETHSLQSSRAQVMDEYGFVFLPHTATLSAGTEEAAEEENTEPTSPAPLHEAGLTVEEPVPPPPDRASRSGTNLMSVERHTARWPSLSSFDRATAPAPSLSSFDRFLSLRSRDDLADLAPVLPTQQSHRSAGPIPADGRPDARSGRDTTTAPPSIPSLPLPAFLRDEAGATTRAAPLRVVAFDPVFQRREHVRALEGHGLQLVHRSPRHPDRSLPDLIIDPTTCIILCRLVDLMKTIQAQKDSSAATGARPNTIAARIEELAQDYEHVVLILEEQHQRVAGVRVSSYSKPVLDALDRLGASVEDLRNRGVLVDVALSRSPEHSADIVAQLVSYKASNLPRDVPALDIWSDRLWLTSDPTNEEDELLRYGDINELGACAILAVCSLSDFLGMSSKDRTAVFAILVGRKTIERLNHALKTISELSPEPIEPRRLSAIDADQDADAVEVDKSHDSFDWTEFLKELSQ